MLTHDPVANNPPAGGGSVASRDSRFLFVSLIALGILVYAWVLALSKTANDFNLDPSYITFFQTLAFGVNIVAICCTHSAKPSGIAAALALFVGQFIVYMIVIAFVYPHECAFTVYTRGTEYSGSEIHHMQDDSGNTIEKKTIAVECSVKICAFPDFCTDGGREFFTCLAHATPLVFAFGFHNALQQAIEGTMNVSAAVNSLIVALNMVDIQDFWVLFLDDGIIKNHWGRDNCDEDGCSGKQGNTWRMILLFFVTSSLTTLYMLVDSVFVAVSGKNLASLFWAIEQQLASHVSWVAFANLCCLEVPFFVLRVWCSFKFDIVASTLLVKNAFGILFNFVRCYYGDNITNFAAQHPQLGAFLTSASRSLYGGVMSEQTSVMPDQSEQNISIDIRDNNTDNNYSGTAAISLDSYLRANKFVVSSLAVIIYAWVSVLTKTVNDFKLKHDVIEVIWFSAIAMNCWVFYLFWRKKSWNVTAGLSLFVIQFPVYMTVIALTYPHECDFTLYEEGTQYKGNAIVEMGKATAGTNSDDKEIQVDCDVKICFPFTDFCTDGGRELFTCLAHATPLVFALGFSSALEDSLQRTAASAVLSSSLILLNMVDIQDFWVLFLEDDIIKNYWGRDNCESGSIFAKYKCSGRSHLTWLLLLVFFWTSILTALFPLVNCVLIVLNLPAPWNDSQGASADRGRTVRRQALSIMLCHELPFFVLRIWCSMTFDIVASTLVVKNLVGICVMSGIWWYDGRLEDAARAHPFYGEFLMKVAGAVYTDDSVDGYLRATDDSVDECDNDGAVSRVSSRQSEVRDLVIREERDEESDDEDDNPNRRFRNMAARAAEE